MENRKIFRSIDDNIIAGVNASPNPFNNELNVELNLEEGAEATIQLFDMLGKERVTLVNQNLSAGTYKTEFDAATLPSGTYFYRLTAGEYTETRKISGV